MPDSDDPSRLIVLLIEGENAKHTSLSKSVWAHNQQAKEVVAHATAKVPLWSRIETFWLFFCCSTCTLLNQMQLVRRLSSTQKAVPSTESTHCVRPLIESKEKSHVWYRLRLLIVPPRRHFDIRPLLSAGDMEQTAKRALVVVVARLSIMIMEAGQQPMLSGNFSPRRLWAARREYTGRENIIKTRHNRPANQPADWPHTNTHTSGHFGQHWI